jgi:hypothetical protein
MSSKKRGNSNLQMPVKQNGEKDNRFKDRQFCNKKIEF